MEQGEWLVRKAGEPGGEGNESMQDGGKGLQGREVVRLRLTCSGVRL